MHVSECISAGEIACRRCEGIGSRGQVVGWLECIISDISSFVREEKEGREKMVSCVSACWEFLGE